MVLRRLLNFRPAATDTPAAQERPASLSQRRRGDTSLISTGFLSLSESAPDALVASFQSVANMTPEVAKTQVRALRQQLLAVPQAAAPWQQVCAALAPGVLARSFSAAVEQLTQHPLLPLLSAAWPTQSVGEVVPRYALSLLIGRDIEPFALQAVATGDFSSMLLGRERLGPLQALGGLVLSPAVAAIARWQPDDKFVPLYAQLAQAHGLGGEARRTVRWLASLHGPQQPVFGTSRSHRRGRHQVIDLSVSGTLYTDLVSALVAAVPASYRDDILTVTVGAPWQCADDNWMTFHGRTRLGFVPAIKTLLEACDAALSAAWLEDGHQVGARTKAMANRFTAGCSDGKAMEALDALATRTGGIEEIAQVDHLWALAQSDKSKLTDVATEHVRAFHAQAWRRYAGDHGLSTTQGLTATIRASLDRDPAFVADYYNTALFERSLQEEKAALGRLPAATLNSLIAEQVDLFMTIERPAT